MFLQHKQYVEISTSTNNVVPAVLVVPLQQADGVKHAVRPEGKDRKRLVFVKLRQRVVIAKASASPGCHSYNMPRPTASLLLVMAVLYNWQIMLQG